MHVKCASLMPTVLTPAFPHERGRRQQQPSTRGTRVDLVRDLTRPHLRQLVEKGVQFRTWLMDTVVPHGSITLGYRQPAPAAQSAVGAGRYRQLMASTRAQQPVNAREVLLPLRGRTIRTVPRGQPNTILDVTPTQVVVGTGRTPGGAPVPISYVQEALERLHEHGELVISVPSLGHRRGPRSLAPS